MVHLAPFYSVFFTFSHHRRLSHDSLPVRISTLKDPQVFPFRSSRLGSSKQCYSSYGQDSIQFLHGADEFMSFLRTDESTEGSQEDDRICVVRFSAEWCKACKSLDGRYHKLAEKCLELPERPVRFAEVYYKGNELLCDALGVSKFPSVHVYKGCSGLLRSLTGCKKAKNDDKSLQTIPVSNMITQLKDELNILLEEREKSGGNADEADECVYMDISTRES